MPVCRAAHPSTFRMTHTVKAEGDAHSFETVIGLVSVARLFEKKKTGQQSRGKSSI